MGRRCIDVCAGALIIKELAMIRVNEISDRLLHLVGWQQNLGTSGVKVADYLTKSESGMYFQQVHPLLTLENLACIAPDFKNMDFPEYSTESNYKVGDYVWHNGKLYKALKDVLPTVTEEAPFIGTPIKIAFRPEGQVFTEGYAFDATSMEPVEVFPPHSADCEVRSNSISINLKLPLGHTGYSLRVRGPFNVGLRPYPEYTYEVRANLRVSYNIVNGGDDDFIVIPLGIGTFVGYLDEEDGPVMSGTIKKTYFSVDGVEYTDGIYTGLFTDLPESEAPDLSESGIRYFRISSGSSIQIKAKDEYTQRCQEDAFAKFNFAVYVNILDITGTTGFRPDSGTLVPSDCTYEAEIELSDFTITPIDKMPTAPEVPPTIVQVSESVEPGTDGSVWQQTDEFSEWLLRKTQASIQKAVVRFCNEKAAEGTNRMLVENKTLFDGTGRISDTVKNRNDLVGFEIVPIRAKGVTTRINRISLQFTEPGEYTLYLMHSGMDVPVKVIKLTKVRKNSVEWFDTDDFVLPYEDTDNDAGGSWYLCYRQSELPAGSMAIRKNKDWSKEPCRGCSRNEYLSWQAWSKYLEVHPFYISEELVSPVADFNDDYSDDFAKAPLRMWDIEKNDYTYDNNYGLNLDLTVACDLTGFIVDQRYLFQDVIAKQVAVDMLREFAYNANVRTNRHSINASRLDILYELDGDSSSMKKSGLNYQLDMAYKAIKLNTMGMSRVCLPCKNNGIKFRTV